MSINTRRTLFSAWIIAFAIVVAGDARADDSAKTKFNFQSDAGKELISKAASMPKEELSAMLKAGAEKKLDEHENQPLSLLLMYDKPIPFTDKDLQKRKFDEFFPAGDDHQLDPLAIVDAIKKSPESPSFIQPEYIKQLDVVTVGDSAKGTVAFEVKGAYHGKVGFAAKKIGDRWVVNQFILPARGVAVVLKDDGKWKIEKIEAK